MGRGGARANHGRDSPFTCRGPSRGYGRARSHDPTVVLHVTPRSNLPSQGCGEEPTRPPPDASIPSRGDVWVPSPLPRLRGWGDPVKLGIDALNWNHAINPFFARGTRRHDGRGGSIAVAGFAASSDQSISTSWLGTQRRPCAGSIVTREQASRRRRSHGSPCTRCWCALRQGPRGAAKVCRVRVHRRPRVAICSCARRSQATASATWCAARAAARGVARGWLQRAIDARETPGRARQDAEYGHSFDSEIVSLFAVCVVGVLCDPEGLFSVTGVLV